MSARGRRKKGRFRSRKKKLAIPKRTSCVTTNASAPATAPSVAVTSSASHQAVEAGERGRGGGGAEGGMSRTVRCCCFRRWANDCGCDDDELGLAAAIVTTRCEIDDVGHRRACGRGQLVGARGLATMRMSDVEFDVVVVAVRGMGNFFSPRAPRNSRNYSASFASMGPKKSVLSP